MKLIIVESPTKIRSFKKILGKDDDEYEFYATLGHFRDLPKNKMGLNIKESFKPKYVIDKRKQKVVKKLKELGLQAQEIILATDPDREGEAIAYHTAYILGFIEEEWPDFHILTSNKKTLKRIIFHEITTNAIKEALNSAGKLREDLIKAQFARRILDRLVGYSISPLLWKKVGKNWLSAGRVQTVALRLIVEREKEREGFKGESYFVVFGKFVKENFSLEAELKKLEGKNIHIKKEIQLFSKKYTYSLTKLKKENINKVLRRLKNEEYFVSDLSETIVERSPLPPFTTSLLQQEASRKFGYSSKYTMKLAQDLYERGIITYHRTDSFNLSKSFILKARKLIKEIFGKDYLYDKVRQYKTKSKLAQEAHEAIRPTNLGLTLEKFDSIGLTSAHKRIYSLIYKRSVATQMKNARIKIFKIEISSKRDDLFSVRTDAIIFPGFLKMFDYKKESIERFKGFEKGEKVFLKEIVTKERETSLPPRYTEASLIKELEEKGIGRPSTYAPIVSLLQERQYVEKSQGYFIPTLLGRKVCNFLTKTFPDLFDLKFTAKMEDELDNIASGNKDLVLVLNEFYTPLKDNLEKVKLNKNFLNIEEKTDEKCPKCGKNLVIRFSKYGKFLGCSGYPECKFVKEYLNIVEGKKCPECGGKVVLRKTKSGKRFYGCSNYPQCKWSVWRLSQI